MFVVKTAHSLVLIYLVIGDVPVHVLDSFDLSSATRGASGKKSQMVW